MKLGQYLTENNLSTREFAARVGVTAEQCIETYRDTCE